MRDGAVDCTAAASVEMLLAFGTTASWAQQKVRPECASWSYRHLVAVWASRNIYVVLERVFSGDESCVSGHDGRVIHAALGGDSLITPDLPECSRGKALVQ
jgi:hypothetical protein